MAAPDPRALHESVRVRGDGLDTAKRRIIREAHRLLADTGGRYGIHELCLLPEDLDPEHAEEITRDLGAAIHVGARPLTPRGWAALLAAEGSTVTAHRRTPMALLEPRRLIADEGFTQTLGIAGQALRDPAARRRVLEMRRVFRRHRAHLGAVSLIATPTTSTSPGREDPHVRHRDPRPDRRTAPGG